jgi:hypothetical protein
MKQLLKPASILLLSALVAAPAAAQVEAAPAAVSAPAPIAAEPTGNATLRAGTPIALSLMEEITTEKKSARVGQRFMLEVAAPIEINGVAVIPSGTPAWGEITGVRNKGMWGKSGKLDARLLYLRVNGRQIRLAGTFDDKGVTGTAGVVGAVVLIPIAGFFMTGTSAKLPKGAAVNGFVDEDVVLALKSEAAEPMQVPVVAPPMAVPGAAPEPVVKPADPASPIATLGNQPGATAN